MKIGIIVAMQSELECVRCLLENPREEQHGSSLFIIGTNGKHELILTQSGIGKVSSAIRTYELIDRYAPDCILNTGVAGGIDRSMHVMDIVVGSEIVYHDVWCVRRRLCMGADRRTSRPVPQRPGIGGKGIESIDRLVSL